MMKQSHSTKPGVHLTDRGRLVLGLVIVGAGFLVNALIPLDPWGRL